jgi:hypothetical protein
MKLDGFPSLEASRGLLEIGGNGLNPWRPTTGALLADGHGVGEERMIRN